MRNGQQHMGAADLPRPKEIVFHVTCALIVAHGLSPCMAWAQAIVPDGRTLTTVMPDAGAAVVNIHTGTVLGNGNALNSFSRFNVGEGQVANLHVPDTAAALINLVRDQTTTIGGMLNAIKDGKIGGKVYFANPHGFIVSNTGVVNVGSLHVSTPSQQFVDEFFSATGGAEASSAQLVAGTAPRNRDAQVRIDGTVNAIEQVAVSAGSVVVGGKVFTGARFSGTDPDFKDVVNVHGLDAASTVAVHDGRILIVGDDDISVTGTLFDTPGRRRQRRHPAQRRLGGCVERHQPGGPLGHARQRRPRACRRRRRPCRRRRQRAGRRQRRAARRGERHPGPGRHPGCHRHRPRHHGHGEGRA
ncbi:hypothetical protein TMEC54S_03793 [Thauera mechernichensis]